MRWTPKRDRCRGFTFVELCLALAICGLVMGALAAFSLAMASAWHQAERTQALTLRGNQAVARIDDLVQHARLIGAVRTGNLDNPTNTTAAGVVLWKVDTNSDGLIQGAEVELILHDPTSRTLKLYPAGQGNATTAWSYSTVFTAQSVIEDFQVGRTSTTLLRDVSGAVFQSSSTGSTSLSPSLSYALKLVVGAGSESGSQCVVQYGSATVRTPLPIPGT